MLALADDEKYPWEKEKKVKMLATKAFNMVIPLLYRSAEKSQLNLAKPFFVALDTT